MEKIFRSTGIIPEAREKEGDFEIFVGDGFSAPPHDNYRRFGVEPHEYSFGCYVTFWWVGKGEKLFFGRPLFFEAFHEAGMTPESKKKARVAAALKDARDDLRRRKKVAA